MGISNDPGIRFSIYPTKDGLLRAGSAICLALMWAVLQTRGAVFYVTDPSDNTNGFTLRNAIILANSTRGNNIIVLTKNAYRLTLKRFVFMSSLTLPLSPRRGNTRRPLSVCSLTLRPIPAEINGIFRGFPLIPPKQ